MRVIRPFLYLVGILTGAFLIFLVYATVDDYKPVDVDLQYDNNQASLISDSSELKLLIWNIGYAGLDASMDFFYDGGDQMRPSEEGVIHNMEGIVKILTPHLDDDFILLQEVDRNSKRSYHYNQFKILEEHFQQFEAFFGMNYKVFFVPIPLKNPMGKVESGLMTLSKYSPSGVSRHSFPGNYSWPMKLFMLDRCFLVNRYPVNNGKELVIINTHNSAYDDGTLREQQMSFLKDFMLTEYEKGNYLIIGGDWNQTPYGFDPVLPSHQFDTLNLTYVDKDYPAADWNWAFDPSLPTNRRVAVPYNRATSLTTVIDYYLFSPNIKLNEVKTVDVNFEFSDHQPVQVKAKLIPNE
ncbi:MAG: endonuclease/exonuclease/phosphatase family protein [Bacteroidota bacterium]